MALTASSFMNINDEGQNIAKRSGTSYLTSGTIARLNAQYQQDAQEALEAQSQNNGGFLGGLGYLGEKVAVGFMSSIEGIWDYSAGGLAKLFGADDWAEQQFANDWFGDWYSHPEQWFNPSEGWQTAGDIAGGIGTSLPAIAASIGAVAIAVGTAGAGTPVSAGILAAVGGGTAAVTAGLGAAGTATKQAYLESGQLTGKEFGYGALSGITEGALEGVTTALSLGSGQIVKSVAKSFAKETTKTIAKQSVIKTLAAGFIGEAFEEGMAEILDPYWQRMTYNPDAKNATPQEVAYAAFVGGMSGMIMGGTGAVVSSTNSFIKGNNLVSKGLDAEVLGLSQQLAEFENTNNTGDETFQNIAQTYADLTQSLATTDGVVKTVMQKKLLGDLQKANTVAIFKPMIAKSAANIVNNADAIAERLTAYGYKTADGKPITFTAEQLREGVDPNTPTTFSDALKKNSILRELAVADAVGHLVMDTARFEQVTLSGTRLASQVDLNRFMETATPSEINSVSQALGIDNWSTLTADTFNQKIADFVSNGGVQQYAQRRTIAQTAQSIPAETARKMPKMVNLRENGTVRYTDGTTQIAITRDGDAYTIYDYSSGQMSKNLTRSEVNKLLRDYNTQQADILAANKAQMEQAAQLRQQAEEIDSYARENIPDYMRLSDPNKSMIRKVIREGRSTGIAADQLLEIARVSAHAGVDVTFDEKSNYRGHDKEGNEVFSDGYYDPNTNRIVVNPNSKRTTERVIIHELDHAIRMFLGEDGVRHSKVFRQALEGVSPEVRESLVRTYRNVDSSVSNLELVMDETNAYFAEDILSNQHTLEKLVEAEPTLKDKILSFFKGASEDYKDSPKLSKAARKYYRTYKKLFDQFAARNFQNNAMEAQTARISGDVSDARFSLQFADTIAEGQRRFVINNDVALSQEELEMAIEQTAHMVEVMSKYKDILPEDKVGRTLVKNGSYDLSVENTTICVRTLAYNSFVEMVSEKIGRPLTQMESFLVSQKLYDIAKEPQCLYCYVSLDRKAYNDMVLRYIDQRDTAIEAYERAGRPEITRDSQLYKDYLAGRKDTKDQWRRYNDWISRYNKGEKLLTTADVITERQRAEFARGTSSQASQVKDMLRYAQNASHAKLQTDYVAYYDDILRLSNNVVRNLNKHYGLRWYSFSDYSGAFIVENMQQVTDASIRGLKGLSYTKDTDYARIFAPTGMNINISVYAKKVGDHYEIDPSMSADIDEAIALRQQYKNVGIVVVATDRAGVEWALAQEWSDVVIPFHIVRTGAQVAEFYNWTVFNEEQNDTIRDQNLWDAYVSSVAGESASARKKVSKLIYPSEHQNNRETYLKLIEERGLTPRFRSFLDNPNYMKLVNETRQSEAETVALKPVFDLDAAETSFGKFVDKGGYYEGWYNDGIDVESEAETVARDVLAGKRANEVDYGRQDIDVEELAKGRKTNRTHGGDIRYALPLTDSNGNTIEYSQEDLAYQEAVQNGDMETARRLVDAAARKAGYTIHAYHGTNAEFTVFDTNRQGQGIDQYGAGFYFASNEDVSERYGHRKLDTYLKLEKPIRILRKGESGNLFDKRITKAQAYQVLKRHPLMYDAENSPLGDFYEEYWEVGAKEWMVKDLAGRFTSIGELDSSGLLFREYPNELHEALRDVCGFDGVLVHFETDAMIDERNDEYYITWFPEQSKSSEIITTDDNGDLIPLSKRFDSSNPDIRYALSPVTPAKPSSESWSPTIDTQEAMRRFPNLWNVTADESETRNPTQIRGTVTTYRKIYSRLQSEGFDGTILDASSGLGYGTRAGIEDFGFAVDDIEPYPDKSYSPKFTDYSKLKKKYDVIISNAVLNVLPQDQRDALVVKMGSLLNNGGRIFVNVRGDDVNNLSSNPKNTKIGDMEWYVESTGSYQKGFTRTELVAYLEDALGDGFTVEPTTFFGKSAAIVTKGVSTNRDIRYALSETRGSIMTDVDPEYTPTVKDKVFSGWTAGQIAFTNAQAGIEAYGRQNGIKSIESLVQAARSGRNQAEEMIAGNQYRIGAQNKVYQGEGLEQIFRPISKQGAEVRGDFFDYLFNYHNMSRMSLNERSNAEQAQRQSDLQAKVSELNKLGRKIKKLQEQISKLGRSKKDMETKRGLREQLKTAKEQAKALQKEARELEKVIKAFVPLENKAVLGYTDENGVETVVTAEQSKEIVAKYEAKYPEFKATAEKVWQFLQNLNQYRVDTGLISQDTFDYLAKLYPHYVPTYRTGAKKGIGAIEGKYNLKVKTTIKTATGSTRDLLPPDVMIARQVMETVRAGRINQLANALYEAAEKSGDTTYIEIVSREKVSHETLADLDPTELRPKNNEIVFFRDGERLTMRVSKEIFAGFNAFNPEVEIHNPLINGARAINNGFKRLVTSLNPAFLVRNTIRDVQDAGINTRYGKTFIKNYARASYEISHNGKLWQLYKAMGGFSSSVFDFEKGFSGMQNRWGLTKAEGNLLKQGLTAIENANAFVEQLPRLAEFISSLEAGNTAEQAVLDSADVTTNFGRTGTVTKVLNRTLIPFLNPSIQGFSKMIRNITSIRSAKELASFLVKVTIVGIAPQIINMLMYGDDEDYKNLRDNDKENNFLFKVGDTFIKIPRGRVASTIGGLINRTASAAQGEDVDWAGYVDNVMQQVTPVDSMSRTIFSPFKDVATNTSWYGSAIEGRQFENTAPKDRYDESTSSIAIAIGQAINYSPKKIHYLLDQYSGVIGDFILPATTAKAEKDFIRGNFTLDPATSNKLSTEFYEMYDKAQYAKTAGDETAAYQVRYLNKVKDAISDMYKQKSEIQNSDLSNADKLQQSRVIQLLINEAYKTAMQDFDLYTKAIEATTGMEDESLRFTEATRLMYGAERALSEYNKDVYAKCQVLNKAGVTYDMLYNYYFTVRGLESDKDSSGNTINGSKRRKVVASIQSLDLKVDQKLLLIAASGYSLQDNDIPRMSGVNAKKRLLRYILSLKGVSQSEKAEIAELCGFEVKNGKVVTKTAFG